MGLVLLFAYGMWFGIVYRRWHLFGTVTFIAAQVTVLTLLLIGGHYPGVAYYFSPVSAAGLTGLLAALAALLLAGGYATIRRVTV